MSRRDSKTNVKYLGVLKELHQILQTPTEINAVEFLKSRNVNNGIFKQLKELDYIKNTAPRTYKWIGKKPSIYLAEEVRTRHIELCTTKYKTPRKIRNIEVEAEVVSPKRRMRRKSIRPMEITTKILFGLITLRSEIRYK